MSTSTCRPDFYAGWAFPTVSSKSSAGSHHVYLRKLAGQQTLKAILVSGRWTKLGSQQAPDAERPLTMYGRTILPMLYISVVQGNSLECLLLAGSVCFHHCTTTVAMKVRLELLQLRRWLCG